MRWLLDHDGCRSCPSRTGCHPWGGVLAAVVLRENVAGRRWQVSARRVLCCGWSPAIANFALRIPVRQVLLDKTVQPNTKKVLLRSRKALQRDDGGQLRQTYPFAYMESMAFFCLAADLRAAYLGIIAFLIVPFSNSPPCMCSLQQTSRLFALIGKGRQAMLFSPDPLRIPHCPARSRHG